MGCDIHLVAQKKNKNNEWQDIDNISGGKCYPFDDRNYGMFAFFAGVRNWSGVPCITGKPRGFPEDFVDTEDYGGMGGYTEVSTKDRHGGMWMGDHSYSWLSMEELLNWDYTSLVEDRRVTINGNGGCTAPVGEGEVMTWAEFLGTNYMEDLQRLKESGAERIVFGFDN